MPVASVRARAMAETRERIVRVAIEVLGTDPDAGMGEIASAAGVVRRTVYGHFPSRIDLLRTLTERAAGEIADVLAEVDGPDRAADAVWAAFIAELWPLVRRYRVLVALRRGEYGEEIHALLGPIEEPLAGLVERGQREGAFGRHLPAAVLSQIAWSAVFTVADSDRSARAQASRAATITSLLVLGVSRERIDELVDRPPG